GAIARPGESVPRRLADHQRVAVVRRGVRHHPRRATARHHRHRVLPVGPRLRAVRRRVRRRDGLCPVRGHPGDHRRPIPSRPQPRAHLMTKPQLSTLAAEPVPPVTDRTAAPVPSGRRWRPRLRLPFSPWHLVLIPLSFILVVPLLWMLVTSLETE